MFTRIRIKIFVLNLFFFGLVIKNLLVKQETGFERVIKIK